MRFPAWESVPTGAGSICSIHALDALSSGLTFVDGEYTKHVYPSTLPRVAAHTQSASPSTQVIRRREAVAVYQRSFSGGVVTNLTVWLVVGCATGWLVSVVMRAETQSAVLLNVLIGTVGAILGGWALSPLVGTTSGQNDFSMSALLTSFLGAAALLAGIHYLRRTAAR